VLFAVTFSDDPWVHPGSSYEVKLPAPALTIDTGASDATKARLLTVLAHVKEVFEETGIDCDPVQLLAVIDGQRMGFTRFAMYLLLFHCTATGGELVGHPLETAGVGWFNRDELPWPCAGANWWGPMAFAIMGGLLVATVLTLIFLPALYVTFFGIRESTGAQQVAAA
jgi:8-oxo-dGTP pyrophosphatase MutT (NUDIX family)